MYYYNIMSDNHTESGTVFLCMCVTVKKKWRDVYGYVYAPLLILFSFDFLQQDRWLHFLHVVVVVVNRT